MKIQSLEEKLKRVRQKQNKLKVNNSQLTNISKQVAYRKNDNFATKIEDILDQKLKMVYKNSDIDRKINEINNRKENIYNQAKEKILQGKGKTCNLTTISSFVVPLGES